MTGKNLKKLVLLHFCEKYFFSMLIDLWFSGLIIDNLEVSLHGNNTSY